MTACNVVLYSQCDKVPYLINRTGDRFEISPGYAESQ